VNTSTFEIAAQVASNEMVGTYLNTVLKKETVASVVSTTRHIAKAVKIRTIVA